MRSMSLKFLINQYLKKDKLTYEDMMIDQIKDSIKLKGEPDLQSLIDGSETWEVK